MESTVKTSGGPPSCKRVLIVEDDLSTATAMAEFVAELGCEVLIATDGIEAVCKAAQFYPNIILLDINLPNLNGYQVTQALRQTPGLSSVLIIAITGYGEPEDKRKAYDAGIDLHLTKPIKTGFLTELISVFGNG